MGKNPGEVMFEDENNLKIQHSDDFWEGSDIHVIKETDDTRGEDRYLITTLVGVDVVWNGKYRIEISIEPSMGSAVVGMCGSANNDSKDDIKTRGGDVISSVDQPDIDNFANTWEVTNSCNTL
nr:PREDICTED: mucin-19-like [Saccoglossus kowalevskii]